MFFNNSQIIVPQGQQQVNVTIKRTGDLSKKTEVTCVVYSNNDTNKYYKNYHVVFKYQQNETFFTIKVYPVREGTEVLSIRMKEPYKGQMGTPNVAQVILKAKQGRHATHTPTHTHVHIYNTRVHIHPHTNIHT